MSEYQEQLAVINDIIKDVKYAMLTTITQEGHLHACPMTTTDFDLNSQEIWFIGDASTQSVQDLKMNEQVNLSYVSTNGKAHLSINGIAKLVDDSAKKDALWSPIYQAFFEKGKDDPNVQLIKVIPNGAQYWTSANALATVVKMAATVVTGGKIVDSLGDSHSVKF